jgi:hypothetical protein
MRLDLGDTLSVQGTMTAGIYEKDGDMSLPCASLRSRQPRDAFMGLSRGPEIIAMPRCVWAEREC